jgi:DnaJ-class molecular chaperone
MDRVKKYVPSLGEYRDTIECLCHSCDGNGKRMGVKCNRCKGLGFTEQIKYLQGDSHKIAALEDERFLTKIRK